MDIIKWWNFMFEGTKVLGIKLPRNRQKFFSQKVHLHTWWPRYGPKLSRSEKATTTSVEIIYFKAARLMKAFDLESVQTLTSAEDIKQKEAEDRRNCAYCKKPSAKNRCSRCHNQRYCDRDCQLKHWSKHKLSCQEKWINLPFNNWKFKFVNQKK